MRLFAGAAAVVAITAGGIGLWAHGDVASGLGRSTQREHSGILKLGCSDSPGQQGQSGETTAGGVEGINLPSSGSFASLTPIRGPGDRSYFVYKAFLAVSPADAPYAIVSIVHPRSASLYYGSPGEVGRLANEGGGTALVAASMSGARLPVCGRRFTGYVGGIVVVKPTTVTFTISSPHHATRTVTIAVGTR